MTDTLDRSEQDAIPKPQEITVAAAPELSVTEQPSRSRGGSGQQGDARARALALSAEGVSKRQIAAQLGVHPTTVGRWVNAPDRQQDGDPHD